MQFLIDFARESEEFQTISRRAAEFETVQGVVLDIDRLWLRSWHLKNRWGEDQVSRWYDLWFEHPRFDLPMLGRFGGLEGLSRDPVFDQPLTADDVENWLPDFMRFATRGKSPIVVKVCTRRRQNADEVIPTHDRIQPGSGRLRVEIDTRPLAQLTSNPRKSYVPIKGGISIGVGSTDFGTLGLILTDKLGTKYGLTCSHVAAAKAQVKQPSQPDSSSPNIIGQSIVATTLSPFPAGSPCNPFISGIKPNDVDLSLIKIDSNSVTSLLEVLDIGSLCGVMPRAGISPGDQVEVMARTSKLNLLQVGGLGVWYKFTHHGQTYCFRNLFEVESPYGNAGVIKSGDSGGPVCAQDADGIAWAGMIVGRDAFKGYAMYAETADNWLNGQGYTLSVN